jgi:hypothetical protein
MNKFLRGFLRFFRTGLKPSQAFLTQTFSQIRDRLPKNYVGAAGQVKNELFSLEWDGGYLILSSEGRAFFHVFKNSEGTGEHYDNYSLVEYDYKNDKDVFYPDEFTALLEDFEKEKGSLIRSPDSKLK